MAKVLIVEDEPMLRMTYKIILSTDGHEIIEAVDGKVGLEKLKESKPDVVLLDINMPNIDGIEFLRRAHIAKKYPNTTVIVFSNLEQTNQLNEAYALGADRYVLKASVSPKELTKLVREVLESKR